MPATRPFGKRVAPRAPRRAAPRAAPSPASDHAAFFAEARRAAAEAEITSRALVVPRSYKAAFLSGLVVGCALAGFSVTGARDPFTEIGQALGTSIDTRAALPVLLLLGLFGGARAAAMTVLPVHGLLARAAQTSHAAYAAGGAIAAAAVAGTLLVLLGHAPAHGWPVEIAAGAGCGFLYRVFAGSRLAPDERQPLTSPRRREFTMNERLTGPATRSTISRSNGGDAGCRHE